MYKNIYSNNLTYLLTVVLLTSPFFMVVAETQSLIWNASEANAVQNCAATLCELIRERWTKLLFMKIHIRKSNIYTFFFFTKLYLRLLTVTDFTK